MFAHPVSKSRVNGNWFFYASAKKVVMVLSTVFLFAAYNPLDTFRLFGLT